MVCDVGGRSTEASHYSTTHIKYTASAPSQFRDAPHMFGIFRIIPKQVDIFPHHPKFPIQLLECICCIGILVLLVASTLGNPGTRPFPCHFTTQTQMPGSEFCQNSTVNNDTQLLFDHKFSGFHLVHHHFQYLVLIPAPKQHLFSNI